MVDQAEKRCQEAEAEIQTRKANIAKLKKEAAELMQQNRAIKLEMLASTSWASPSLLKMYEEPVQP